MSVTSSEFIESARVLIADGTQDEIAHRNSTSRAYYAAYHLAQKSVDLCPDNAHKAMGSHERLSARFYDHEARSAKAISIVLQNMKRLRNQADYEISDPFDLHTANNQIQQFESLSDRLKSFENTFRSKVA